LIDAAALRAMPAPTSLAERHGDAVPLDRNGVAEELVDGAGVVADDVDDHPELPARVRDRHADVAALDHGQLLRMLLDQGGEPVHRSPPRDGGQRAPLLVGRSGRGHGPVDVLGAGLRNGREALAGGRVDHVEGAALGRFCALPADQQALGDGG